MPGINRWQSAKHSKRRTHLTHVAIYALVELVATGQSIPSNNTAFAGACGPQDVCLPSDRYLGEAQGHVKQGPLCNILLQLGRGRVRPIRTQAYHPDNETEDEKEKKDESDAMRYWNASGFWNWDPDLKEVRGVETETAARPVALVMVSSILLLTIAFAMSHASHLYLSNCMLLAVENTVAIFVAVLWFQAMYTLLKFIVSPHHQVAAAAIHALWWLLLMVVGAWSLRSQWSLLAVIGGWGLFMAALSSALFAYILQKNYFSNTLEKCLLGLAISIVVVLLLYIGLYVLKKAAFHAPGVESYEYGVNEWNEVTDVVETDFFAMAVAVSLTEFIRFYISDSFPQFKGTDINVQHTYRDRFMLLLWAVIAGLAGSVMVSVLTKLREHKLLSYHSRRFISFFSSLVPLCVVWAILHFGQWYFYEEFTGPIYARIEFAIVCTVIALCGVYALSLPSVIRSRFCRADIGIKALSLLVAWSWEQAYDATFEEGVTRWYTKLVPALLVGLVAVPVLLWYFKPLTIRIKEEVKHWYVPNLVDYPNGRWDLPPTLERTIPQTDERVILAQSNAPTWTLPLSQDRVGGARY